MYDVIFISYDEKNADANFARLQEKVPIAIRVHGVEGIHNAHVAAARTSATKMFYVVDGDAWINDDFEFNYAVPTQDLSTVHVWRSLNPINGLCYGYGGVKLLPRKLTLNMDLTKPDMTTSISTYFKVMDATSNVSKFNTDPYNTWKSAFRECVKLASGAIDRQVDAETTDRLERWLSWNQDTEFGIDAKLGAEAGLNYGTAHRNNSEELAKINDFTWLRDYYNFRQYGS